MVKNLAIGVVICEWMKMRFNPFQNNIDIRV